MPSFTRQAIKNSFLKLLNERPIHQITVKDVVEDCGVNRNSFYYHFRDFPSLIEEIIMEDADKIISGKTGSRTLEECLDTVIDFAIKNKRAVLHIYHSASREVFEQYLRKICRNAIAKYMDTAFCGLAISEEDRALLVKLIQCEFFGQIMEWLNEGMSYSIQNEFHRLYELLGGTAEKVIQNLQATGAAPGKTARQAPRERPAREEPAD